MFKFFRKSTQSKNLANKNLKDYKLGVKMITSTSEKGDKYFHVDYNIEQIYLSDKKSEDPGRYKEYYS